MAIPESLREAFVEKMTEEFGDEAGALAALTHGEKPPATRQRIRGIFHPNEPGAVHAPDYQEDGNNLTMTLCGRYGIRLNDKNEVVPVLPRK
jgi:hypothetical protein